MLNKNPYNIPPIQPQRRRNRIPKTTPRPLNRRTLRYQKFDQLNMPTHNRSHQRTIPAERHGTLGINSVAILEEQSRRFKIAQCTCSLQDGAVQVALEVSSAGLQEGLDCVFSSGCHGCVEADFEDVCPSGEEEVGG
jgi:hypothetical protein